MQVRILLGAPYEICHKFRHLKPGLTMTTENNDGPASPPESWQKEVTAETDEVVAIVERSPGVSEANVRSNLRSEHGDSSALDRALASGRVVRSGHKLHVRCEEGKRVTAKHLTHREIRDYRDSVAGSDHIAMYERLMCDTAIGAFALGSTKRAVYAARSHVAAAINARREGNK